MKCKKCKHNVVVPGKVAVNLVRGGQTIIIKDVPAAICENCGEYYLSKQMSERVLAMANTYMENNRGNEVEILKMIA